MQVSQEATPCGLEYSEVATALSTLLELLDPEDDGIMILRTVCMYIYICNSKR